MTTPRIEEKVEKICEFDFENKLWSDSGYNEFKDLLRRAFTEAHQAGIDEAVEVGYKKALREIDIGSHDYVQSRRAISQLSGKPMMALTFDEHLDVIKEKIQALDDTIKALQDNK